jgi:hypothetical protein
LFFRESIGLTNLSKVRDNKAAHFRCRKLTRVVLIIGSPDLIDEFSLLDLMGDSLLNILNFGSSNFVNKRLHLSLVDLTIMIDVD